MLEDSDPVPLAEGSFERLMDRLRGEAPPEEPDGGTQDEPDSPFDPLPLPLRRYLPKGLRGLSWSSLAGGRIRIAELLPPVGSLRTQLVHVRAGSSILPHTHRGMEMSLILSGGYTDEYGQFLRGDVETADDTVTHRPVADTGADCLTLTLVAGDLRFVGPVGTLLSPFIKS